MLIRSRISCERQKDVGMVTSLSGPSYGKGAASISRIGTASA
ncbi:hypothetical protein ASAP_1779 [Asaia bogorensis]|uniref:Uncharacterized protein n=1 Tax=Asaia bogorensis TaxID=91915 RepID=A0A060QFC9_9PROT|nr:hypothetical protein ASAP_1779 [Asaia bogorensis]